MSVIRWTGNGANVKQVSTITVTAYDASTTYKITMNSKVISVVGVTSTSGTASALQAALAASEDPEFPEVDWSVSSAVITATARTAGTPFIATSSVSGGTGTIGAVTASTANASRNDANNSANYSGGAVPGTGDTLIFDDGDVDCLWNLGTAFSSADLAAVIVRDTYRGRIGLPVYSDSGIYEPSYRGGTFTAQTITALTIEQSDAAGPGWYKFNVGSTTCTLLVKGPASSGITSGQETVWFKGTNASNTAALDGGSINVAALSGDTSTLTTLKAVNAAITCTSGVTLTTATLSGCSFVQLCNVTTLNLDGGSAARAENAVTATTVNLKEGSLAWNSSGTITTLTSGGSVDFSGDRRAKTVTNALVMYRGAQLNDPHGVVTYSGGITLTGARLGDVTIDLGVGRSLGSIT